MADDSTPPIAFSNSLAYDVIVYDSFDYDDDDSSSPDAGANGKPDSQAYFATLTQLGKVPAGTTVSIQPLRDSFAFVVENAADNKPIRRLAVLSFDDVTALSLAKADETAMTQMFQFVDFFLNNPTDPLSVAFNKVLNNATDDLGGDINKFFANQSAYNTCCLSDDPFCFEDYMMAMAYTALHPPRPTLPNRPAPPR